MKKAVVILSLCLGLAACQTTSEPAVLPHTKLTLSNSQIEIVKKGVKDSMKDPDSARFDGTFSAAQDADGVIYVCGYVNGKNSFGGYSGSKPFNGILSKSGFFATVSIANTTAEVTVTRTMCERYGTPI